MYENASQDLYDGSWVVIQMSQFLNRISEFWTDLQRQIKLFIVFYRSIYIRHYLTHFMNDHNKIYIYLYLYVILHIIYV